MNPTPALGPEPRSAVLAQVAAWSFVLYVATLPWSIAVMSIGVAVCVALTAAAWVGRSGPRWQRSPVYFAGLLSPDLDLGAEGRSARIASAYDSTVARAPGLIRRYGVKFVVARRAALAGPPVWADPVAANPTYVLLKVRSEVLE